MEEPPENGRYPVGERTSRDPTEILRVSDEGGGGRAAIVQCADGSRQRRALAIGLEEAEEGGGAHVAPAAFNA